MTDKEYQGMKLKKMEEISTLLERLYYFSNFFFFSQVSYLYFVRTIKRCCIFQDLTEYLFKNNHEQYV